MLFDTYSLYMKKCFFNEQMCDIILVVFYMFKKVYVEITNVCNLKCSYCIGNKRKKEYITLDNFREILKKLKGYTKYLYFHIMGEPMMHPLINELIDEAVGNGYFVNITSNGYLIGKIRNNKNIRQLNISLHSFNEKWGVSFDDYIENVFGCVDSLTEIGTIVKYRLWTKNNYADAILKKLENKYNIKIVDDNVKIGNNVYFEKEKEFIWPSMDNDVLDVNGSCRGTRDHIGILVDGTVVPCCLDANGIINLGNIYKNDLDAIISSNLFQKMKQGFCNNRKVHELCQRCNFYDLRNKGDNNG